MGQILTIGHSTHDLDHFLELLVDHGVTAIADVRSVPASRYTPQFNRDSLKIALRRAQVDYVFLGDELGARSRDPDCYVDGRVQYGRLAQTPEFRQGVARLLVGMQSQRVALMCAEQEPLSCHRTILVARVLTKRGVSVAHIHGDGHLEPQGDAMKRLMTGFGLNQPDLFHPEEEERLSEALRRQEKLIAYVENDLEARTV